MTVAQLIAALQLVASDATVTSTNDDGTSHDIWVVVSADGTMVDIGLYGPLRDDVTLVEEGRIV